jgi:PAT family beta-lactamase induction signal transducer AmpG
MKKNIITAMFNRKMGTVLLHGFSSGLPLGLTTSLLQGWMAKEKVDLTTIGLFALVGVPYTIKFLWAPLMDRYVPPLLGRRRGWILVAQIVLMISICMLGFTNPASSPYTTALFALLVAFFSASQDIAIDAYRTDLLHTQETGVGASLYVAGYRVGFPIFSSSIGFILSDYLPWSTIYMIMAGGMLIGVAATLMGPEPEVKVSHPSKLKDAIILPFVEFFKRTGAGEILVFVVLYRLTDVIGTALLTAFLVKTGFSGLTIGTAKGLLWIPLLIGGIIGGATMLKIGVYRSLWVFGILAALSNLFYMALASAGPSVPMLAAALSFDYLCNGMATSAFSAFLMTAVNKKYTATQFALLTSFMAQARVYLAAPAGWFADRMGWQTYFLFSMFLALPGLLMLFRFKRWTLGVPTREAVQAD